MKLSRGQWIGSLCFAALVGFAMRSLYLDSQSSSRSVAIALVPSEVSQTAARSSFPVEDLWERAKTVGVMGAAMTDETLGDLVNSGDVVRISKSDVQKWRLAGLIAPNAPLRADSLWVRDAASVGRVVDAFRRKGIVASTQSFSEVWSIAYPGELDLSKIDVGLDPALLRFIRDQGLTPVDLSTGIAAVPMAHLGPDSGLAEMWRAVYGRGARILILHFDPAMGVEPNMDFLRSAAGALKSAGISLSAPESSPLPPPSPDRDRWMRCVAAVLLCAFAPLLAVRQGLNVLRRTGCRRMMPGMSPLPELFSAVLSVCAVAVLSGLFAYALMAFPEWRAGRLKLPWRLLAAILPLTFGAGGLYVMDLPELAKKIRAAVTYKDLAALSLVSLAAAFIARPGWFISGFHFPWDRNFPNLWWLGARWREIVLGVPCLFVGFWRYMDHLHQLEHVHDGKTGVDSRPWLLVGLLFPIGTLQAFGAARAAVPSLVFQTVAISVAGSLIGFLVIVVLHYVAQGTGHHKHPHE